MMHEDNPREMCRGCEMGVYVPHGVLVPPEGWDTDFCIFSMCPFCRHGRAHLRHRDSDMSDTLFVVYGQQADQYFDALIKHRRKKAEK